MERNRTFWVQHLLKVLILIIMEDTHGEYTVRENSVLFFSLNPYYNGRYSWRD